VLFHDANDLQSIVEKRVTTTDIELKKQTKDLDTKIEGRDRGRVALDEVSLLHRVGIASALLSCG